MSPNKECLVCKEFKQHGEYCEEDCNLCSCNSAHVSCSNIVCGPSNCLNNVSQKTNPCPSQHPCTLKRTSACMKSPCPDWGQCKGKFSEINQGHCTPTTQTSELTKSFAEVNIVFNLERLLQVNLCPCFIICVLVVYNDFL